MVGDIMFMDLLFVLGGSTYRCISRLNEKKCGDETQYHTVL